MRHALKFRAQLRPMTLVILLEFGDELLARGVARLLAVLQRDVTS